MGTTDGNAAGTAADPTVHDAGTTGGQPDYKAQAEENQRRYAGMQGRYQQEHSALLDAQAQITDLKSTLEKITGDHGALETEVDELTKKVGELDTKAKGAESKLARQTLIMTEFPDLIGFEAKGILPAGEGDQLKALLGTFKETLKTAGVQNTLPVGQTPPAPPAANATRATLMAQLRSTAGKDKAAYDQAYAQLLALKD